MAKKQIAVPSKTFSQQWGMAELLSGYYTLYMMKTEEETPDSNNYKYCKTVADEFFKLSERYRRTSTTHLPSRNLSRNLRNHICDILRLEQMEWNIQANKIGIEDEEYPIYIEIGCEFSNLAMKYKPAPKPKPVVQPQAEPEKI
jgi:hypothetical protein